MVSLTNPVTVADPVHIAAKLELLSKTSLDSTESQFKPSEIEILQKVAHEILKTGNLLAPRSFSRTVRVDLSNRLVVMHLSGDKDPILGQGIDKIVHYGVDVLSGRACAVATIKKGNRSATLHEYRVMKNLEDIPNVVHPYGFIRGQNKHDYLVMEPFSADSLGVRLESESLDDLEKFKIVQDTTIALADIHELDFAHRDIKPGNIFLELNSTTGKVKKAVIGDFGFATHLDNPRCSRLFKGNPCYLAPEKLAAINFGIQTDQIEEARKMWASAAKSGDVWALGVVLLEMFTKGPLIKEGSKQFMFDQISCLKQEDLDQRIQQVEHVHMKVILPFMLQIDPAKRWTARDIADLVN